MLSMLDRASRRDRPVVQEHFDRLLASLPPEEKYAARCAVRRPRGAGRVRTGRMANLPPRVTRAIGENYYAELEEAIHGNAH